MPPSDETVSTDVMISDVIGKTQNIAIFSGLTRDIDTIAQRLDDASQNATVLAPQNGAMRNLKRKPWEDPEDYNTFGAKAYEGSAGEDRAHKNLRKFVEAHVIPESPWEEGKKVKTLAGNEIWYEIKDGKKKVCFGHFPHLRAPRGRALTLFSDPAKRCRGYDYRRQSCKRRSLGPCWCSCINYLGYRYHIFGVVLAYFKVLSQAFGETDAL
jgi:hypothetical protein